MSFLRSSALLCVAAWAGAAFSQDSIQLGPAVQPARAEPVEPLRFIRPGQRESVPIPTFASGKKVVAIASAVGGELNYVVSRDSTGSHFEPFQRQRLAIADHSIDAMVMRGVDRVIERAMPDSERVFMRLNPVVLEDVPPYERDKVALERLLTEIGTWPQRQQWDRIVIVTPHYRASERGGLASKLHGVGIYVQNMENNSEYDVVEPDGKPGAKRRNRYVALYYYATMTVLDAKSLRVIEQQPWLIDEKIHDSSASALHIGNSLSLDVLSSRLEHFAESASAKALSRTLGGQVEPGELKVVPPPPAAR